MPASRETERKPTLVKVGNVTVKVYESTRQKKLKDGSLTDHTEFKTVWYSTEGKRQFKTFTSRKDAMAHANTVAAAITRGDAITVSLTGQSVLQYQRAIDALKPLDVALDVAISEYVRARGVLGVATLDDACQFYARNCSGLKSAVVADVVAELVKSRRTPTGGRRPKSEKYLKDLQGRLGRFADFAVNVPIAEVNTDLIREFMKTLAHWEPMTQWNYLRLIRTLMKFAQSRRYYPTNLDPMAELNEDFDFEDDSPIEIFTPAEMTRLLSCARPEMIPFLAIAAFAGIRTAELSRLDWSKVRTSHIEITKGKAKTRSRRLVPIQPNLQAWLAPHRRESGPVVPFSNVAKQIVWLCESTAEPAREDGTRAVPAMEWKHNALRHSFISYRMAVLKDENQVALEAGNSPQKVFSNYRELVEDPTAAAWFSIAPTTAHNILPMTTTAAIA